MIPEFGEALVGIHYKDRPGGYAFLRDSSGLYAMVRTRVGLFLPGGGADSGESPEAALRRELWEEIGYRLTHAELVCQAVQYHWSDFYQSHFKKIGFFFRAQAVAPPLPQLQADHELVWLEKAKAIVQLTQEFQRWAMTQA